MISTHSPGKSFLNEAVYRDKVLGCWTGKNIGGTLGAPMEGQQKTWDIHFYTQDLGGVPAPNDDLDLQLAWLKAVEENGVYNVDEKVLGRAWLRWVTGPWNEYGIGKMNMTNGIQPPLSGLCNNEVWQNSNGAWIRSEIWACLFPGEPDEAAQLAWCDACVDHAGDGIYAEIFTATLEAAAFIESDLRKLIAYALARIPADCRVARSVKIACDCYDQGLPWLDARNRIVKDSEDLGWFQAPANVAFAVVGLLYGEGDFGKSVCLAVNCGDDTDCTGATCGSVLGIIKGRSGLPKEWIEPIGESIQTIAVNAAGSYPAFPVTLDELTDRVLACKRHADATNPSLVRLTDDETTISAEHLERLPSGTLVEQNVLSKSSRAMEVETPWGILEIEFEKSPVVAPGESQQLTLRFKAGYFLNSMLQVKWRLPEGWSIAEGDTQALLGYATQFSEIKVTLTVGEFPDGYLCHIPLLFTLNTQNYPAAGFVTFQRAGALAAQVRFHADFKYFERVNHAFCRLNGK
ncbi:MAG: ADP-ribosylglycohydrolase family protein [Victivallales bacterium]|nr:ADP-ribosylglycohydrolase family protein [Victivallales bacterium]